MAWKTSVLVVANQTADSPELIDALREHAAKGGAEFTLVLPPLGGDREAAHARLDAIVESWREAGLEASGRLGDSDPLLAVKEAWDPARFDEVVISTLPTGASKWLQIDLPHRVERMTGVDVRHVIGTAPEEEPEPATTTAIRRPPPPPPGLEHWLGSPRKR
jgi:hypothetical protein